MALAFTSLPCGLKTALSHIRQEPTKAVLLLVLLALTVASMHPAFASSSSGGGLPYEDWINNVRASFTGPWAYGISVIAFVAAGSGLIFGGADMSGAMRTLVWIVLVLSFIIAAQNTLAAITGKGALIDVTAQQLRSLGR